MFSIKNTFLFLTFAFLFSFASEDNNDHKEEENQKYSHKDAVVLSTQEISEFGIEIQKASGGVLTQSTTLNGEVSLNEENLLHISSRFDGVIQKVNVQIGNYVKAGTVLATLENSNNLSTFPLIARKSGTIIYKDAALGEAVQPGSQLFVIADLSTIWVNFGAYQKDALKIKTRQTVLVKDPFQSGLQAKGKIRYVSPILNEESKTIPIRVLLKNKKRQWKPGSFVTGEIITSSQQKKILIPNTSLHTYEGNTVVFIRDQDGFEATSVVIGKSNATHSEIVKGLSLGQKYVSKNGFVIKSELGKSEMSGGHNH